MEEIFVSFHFGPEDRELVQKVRTILESQGVRPVTGEDLGGGQLTQEVMDRIDGCDALVALMTPRDQLASGKFRTHPWVRDEMNHARGSEKRCIAIVDSRVDPEGAYQEHERIVLDSEKPLDAFLKLMRTVGMWRRQAGNLVKVRLSPDDVAARAAIEDPGASCKYRLNRRGSPGHWEAANVFREEGGVFAYLRGVQRDSYFEVRIDLNGKTWLSPATAQYCRADLELLGDQ